jgi:ureidoglycolate lyase
MKLLRYGLSGQERPGLLDSDGCIRDLSRDMADIGPPDATGARRPREAGVGGPINGL